MRLTAQQQAVVNHNYGPALVFAVAGAGKTTTLEQRIARLVGERIFAPERILAAAYNTAVREELGARLRRHAGCAQVEVMTLHALGLRAVKMAWEAGLLPQLKRKAFTETESAQEQILLAAMAEARKQKVSYQRELDSLDRADFFTWISSCKGNLFYPNLAEVPAVLRHTKHAQQAAAPAQTPWYLPFSQLMASVQQAQGLMTFDDQLRLGWEVMVSFPAICTRLQQSYDCVLVDEFQDVNLAQYLILDMITAPRPGKPQRNYMVVGDDDQTIYEWRGANPHFIQSFAKDYKATRYLISENFRCPAGPLTLANAVIRHNRVREPKSLQLTQGFGGVTSITRATDRKQMGQLIVANLRELLGRGDHLPEMAVLVRAKAQTPPVELALIQAQIPYEVVGGEPFYARWEITTLISYCRLALFEQQLQKGKSLTPGEAAQLVESWEEVYRHPKRYINQSEARQISEQLAPGRKPVTQILRNVVVADKPYIQARLGELATLLEWLSKAFAPESAPGIATEIKARGQSKHAKTKAATAKSAHAVLVELEKKLGYCAYLEQRGARSESGVDEAENVRQFIEESKERGSLRDYLVYLKQMAEQQAAQQAAAGRNRLTIRTIHSAKGLEWKVVIIPSCDDDNYPHRKSNNVEEERRLLYVALTRSRRDLYIYHFSGQPSSFLTQAKAATVVKAVNQIGSALDKSPATWSAEEARAVAVAAPQLGLLDYFQTWHRWAPGEEAAFVEAARLALGRERVNGAGRAQLEQMAGDWQKLATPEGLANGAGLNGVGPSGARPKEAGPASAGLELDEWMTPESRPPKLLREQGPANYSASSAAKGHNGQSAPKPAAQPASKANASTPRASTPRASASTASTPMIVRRGGQVWQAFDVVHHPQYGQGIVVSTTTTTRGREIKVQFVSGSLVNFTDDDPHLMKE